MIIYEVDRSERKHWTTICLEMKIKSLNKMKMLTAHYDSTLKRFLPWKSVGQDWKAWKACYTRVTNNEQSHGWNERWIFFFNREANESIPFYYRIQNKKGKSIETTTKMWLQNGVELKFSDGWIDINGLSFHSPFLMFS